MTAYGEDVAAARALIARLAAGMRPAGSVLEIACGTGLWTEALAGWADTVTAIDAAPEMVAIARDRVRSAHVSFEVADVFSWGPGDPVRRDLLLGVALACAGEPVRAVLAVAAGAAGREWPGAVH